MYPTWLFMVVDMLLKYQSGRKSLVIAQEWYEALGTTVFAP